MYSAALGDASHGTRYPRRKHRRRTPRFCTAAGLLIASDGIHNLTDPLQTDHRFPTLLPFPPGTDHERISSIR